MFFLKKKRRRKKLQRDRKGCSIALADGSVDGLPLLRGLCGTTLLPQPLAGGQLSRGRGMGRGRGKLDGVGPLVTDPCRASLSPMESVRAIGNYVINRPGVAGAVLQSPS